MSQVRTVTVVQTSVVQTSVVQTSVVQTSVVQTSVVRPVVVEYVTADHGACCFYQLMSLHQLCPVQKAVAYLMLRYTEPSLL